jgi:hypothetical protein
MNRHCSNPEDHICRMGCAGNAACRFTVLSYIAPMQCGEKERAELASIHAIVGGEPESPTPQEEKGR